MKTLGLFLVSLFFLSYAFEANEKIADSTQQSINVLPSTHITDQDDVDNEFIDIYYLPDSSLSLQIERDTYVKN